MNIFKAVSGIENLDEKMTVEESNAEKLHIENIKREVYSLIEINIVSLTQPIRIDKLLSIQILDISRSKLEEYIKSGSLQRRSI